ncbi:DUF6537 domain-containing protein, partial [Salmonella enterica]|uniref:DUF6537 domain-containing protein n=1 Tax=Salmonella enterica TaxID=28901 RepID=UPI003CE8FA70
VFTLFRLLAGLKGLRGTPLDPFGWTAERRHERRAISDFEALVEQLCAGLDLSTGEVATALARLPQDVRGFGHV